MYKAAERQRRLSGDSGQNYLKLRRDILFTIPAYLLIDVNIILLFTLSLIAVTWCSTKQDLLPNTF